MSIFCVCLDVEWDGSNLILIILRSTLNVSVFVCSPAAVQKEVEGKAMDCIIRIVMSLNCFCDGIIYNDSISV